MRIAIWIGVPVLALAAALMQCAQAGGGGEFPDDVTDGGSCRGLACQVARCAADSPTVLRGRVTVPSGVEPMRQAVVYVPEEDGPLPPLPSALSCEACSSPIRGRVVTSTQTGVDGSFTLRGLPVGDSVPVVVQKGRFRRLFRMPIRACQSQVAAPVGGGSAVGTLALPGRRSEGDLPQIAVAAGDHDAIECVLRHLGIADTEFAGADSPPAGSAPPAVHLYNNQAPGSPVVAGQVPISDLLSDSERLSRYQVVFLNCSDTTYSQGLLRDPRVLAHLRDYVTRGGRLYATDWSYDFLQQVPEFAPFLCFDDDQDCSIRTPHGFHSAVLHGGTLDPLTASVDTSTPQGRALSDWLAGVTANPPLSPAALPIRDLLAGWVVLRQVGEAAYPTTTWLSADVADRLQPPRRRPLTVSFDYPVGAACGRALFSSYHTRQRIMRLPFPGYCPPDGASPLPQEHVLSFLLFELSDCIGPAG